MLEPVVKLLSQSIGGFKMIQRKKQKIEDKTGGGCGSDVPINLTLGNYCSTDHVSDIHDVEIFYFL